VASSSSLDRIRASLDATGLLRFFEPRLFSASNIDRGKPAPDLFLNVADWLQVEPQECIVVEDSAAGIAAASAAGMGPIGFIGGSHAGGGLTRELFAAGARTVIADMRARKKARSSLCAAGSRRAAAGDQPLLAVGFGFDLVGGLCFCGPCTSAA
jgi:beta-phosphoglucomutase-like phosphatase (HAD superfamily)